MRPTRYRRSLRRGRGGGGPGDGMKGVLLVLVVAGVIFFISNFKEEAQRLFTDGNSCFVNAPTPARAAILVDVTDPMAGEQDRLVNAAADRVLDELPVGGLLMVGSITGAVPNQLAPLVETCRPGSDDNTSRRLYREQFTDPLHNSLIELAASTGATASPILETILATANDPALNQAPVTIVVISDFMQFSSIADFYRNAPHLPRPIGRPLNSVRIRMLVFRNADYARLQPAAADAFAVWLSEAGASVDYAPPAWMAVGVETSAMELADAH